MNLLPTIVVALRALLRNKMRSFLTALGVIIGVGAVVAMTSIAAGAQARIEQTFQQMGSNMLVVRAGSSRTRGVHGGAGSRASLTWSDLAAIREQAPSVLYAAPLLSNRAQVMAEGNNWNTTIQGTTAEYFTIANWSIGEGSFFSEGDDSQAQKVAVLGKTVADNLFGPFSDPVGQMIRIDHVPFEVIGVAGSKGQTGHGRDQDDLVFVRARTFRMRLQGGLGQYLDGSVFVSAVSQEATSMAEREISALLRERHRVRPGMDDEFTVRNLSDIADARQQGAQTMSLLLAGIALVSLVVGGIGIMNIMLVSVTERTREIGLRMAVGARPRNIMAQFLTESVALSLVGGLLGVLAGIGAASWLVGRFGWPMLVQPHMVLLAVAFSAAVGIGFGLYPAFKASRLDPITALRYE